MLRNENLVGGGDNYDYRDPFIAPEGTNIDATVDGLVQIREFAHKLRSSKMRQLEGGETESRKANGIKNEINDLFKEHKIKLNAAEAARIATIEDVNNAFVFRNALVDLNNARTLLTEKIKTYNKQNKSDKITAKYPSFKRYNTDSQEKFEKVLQISLNVPEKQKKKKSSKDKKQKEQKSPEKKSESPKKVKMIVKGASKETKPRINLDNINAKNVRENGFLISDNDISRMCRRAGILRAEGGVQHDIRYTMVAFLTEILNDSILNTTEYNRNTIMVKDIVEACEQNGATVTAHGAIKR